jgi:hypothetical protein
MESLTSMMPKLSVIVEGSLLAGRTGLITDTWTRRHFVLASNGEFLKFADPSKETLLWRILLSEVNEVRKFKGTAPCACTIEIVSKERSYLLGVDDNEEHFQRWVQLLSKYVSKVQSCTTTNATKTRSPPASPPSKRKEPKTTRDKKSYSGQTQILSGEAAGTYGMLPAQHLHSSAAGSAGDDEDLSSDDDDGAPKRGDSEDEGYGMPGVTPTDKFTYWGSKDDESKNVVRIARDMYSGIERKVRPYCTDISY